MRAVPSVSATANPSGAAKRPWHAWPLSRKRRSGASSRTSPKAVAVEVDANAGYLHLPLQLVIGASENPDRLHFLVSVLGVRTTQGWRIAALFTTSEKQA